MKPQLATCLFLQLVLLGSARAGSHRLEFIHTLNSAPIYGMPEYFSSAYLNGTELGACDSVSNHCYTRAQWFVETEAFWNITSAANTFLGDEMRGIADLLISKFNKTDGSHVVQLMYGCQTMGNNSSEIFVESAYNGQNLMSFDNNTTPWEIQLTGLYLSEEEKKYLETNASSLIGILDEYCVHYLNKWVDEGKSIIDRTVAAKVKLTHRPLTDRITVLTCNAYGFYPRAIDVYWMKNGDEMSGETQMHDILPNEDGTFQVRATVNINPLSENTYSCQVLHGSIPEGTDLQWAPPNDTSVRVGVIVAVVVIVVLIISVAITLFICRRTPETPVVE